MIGLPKIEHIWLKFHNRYPETSKEVFFQAFAYLMEKEGLFKPAGAFRVDENRFFRLFWYKDTGKRFLVKWKKISDQLLEDMAKKLKELLDLSSLGF